MIDDIMLRASRMHSKEEAIDLCIEFNINVPVHRVTLYMRVTFPEVEIEFMDFTHNLTAVDVLISYVELLYFPDDEGSSSSEVISKKRQRELEANDDDEQKRAVLAQVAPQLRSVFNSIESIVEWKVSFKLVRDKTTKK